METRSRHAAGELRCARRTTWCRGADTPAVGGGRHRGRRPARHAVRATVTDTDTGWGHCTPPGPELPHSFHVYVKCITNPWTMVSASTSPRQTQYHPTRNTTRHPKRVRSHRERRPPGRHRAPAEPGRHSPGEPPRLPSPKEQGRSGERRSPHDLPSANANAALPSRTGGCAARVGRGRRTSHGGTGGRRTPRPAAVPSI